MTAPRPARWLALMFKLPRALFRLRLDWLLGRRFLEVAHVGRVSGKIRRTVLEVIAYDPKTGESFVVSAYGEGADWYRNLALAPPHHVRQAGRGHSAECRFLSGAEAREVAETFCRHHPVEARLARPVLRRIGAAITPQGGTADILARLPMVAFRPVSDSPRRRP